MRDWAVNFGDTIETSYGTGPYRIIGVCKCADKDCFVYWYNNESPVEHYHLDLLDADRKGRSWINGIRNDFTIIHGKNDFITIVPESSFPPDPKSKHIPQLELFA